MFTCIFSHVITITFLFYISIVHYERETVKSIAKCFVFNPTHFFGNYLMNSGKEILWLRHVTLT